MILFLPVLFYLGAHFMLYCLALRHVGVFQREKPIFLYHVLSFLACGAWFFSARSVDSASAIGLLSLHGIYSLSFLELWALCDGGYSLRILESAGSAQGCTVETLECMRLLGSVKTKGRLETLQRWRLVRGHQNQYQLTRFGRVFVSVLQLIVWPSRGRA